MISEKQKRAAKKYIKKAQVKWKSMTSREHALAQPQGKARAKPCTKGEGDFYRIVVRDKKDFVSFRNHDVGKNGHIQRLAGKRKRGNWATHAWLISKKDAQIKNKILIGKSKDSKDLIKNFSSIPKLVKGDIFNAKPRCNVPEKEKPTIAMKKAQNQNIKKAQKTRWKKK